MHGRTDSGGCAAGFAGIWGKPIKNKVAAQFDGRAEAPLAGQIVAALLVDEMRKTLMPLPGEVGPTTRSHILALACPDGAEVVQTPLRASQLHLALVGAGALGTWFGLALGASGIEGAVDIFDDDDIDESNLNRQVLFYEAVGQPKALVLAARLQQFFGRAQWTGYGMAVQEGNSAQLANADVLVACPDNFAARALLNGVARRRRRALINGGTSAMGGSCMTYAPGRTACLSCRMRIEQLAENERQSQSCAQVQAAVVTSNAIIGALMAWKVRKMFDGRVERSIWEYDGRAATARIGAHSPRPACRCHLE